MMLYPSRQDLPEHIPPQLVVDYDTFHVDAPDGDFGAAMVRLREFRRALRCSGPSVTAGTGSQPEPISCAK